MASPPKGQSEKVGIRSILSAALDDIVINHTIGHHATSLERDKAEILLRFDTRGLPFLTSELPEIGKALDSGLKTGRLCDIPRFKNKPGSALPECFYVLWRKLFSDDGNLLEDYCLSAIVDLRFISKAFYKYEMDYTPEVMERSIAKFKATDQAVPTEFPTRGPIAAVLDVARSLISEVLGSPPSFFIPGHSSGAVATGENAWEKTQGLVWSPQHRVLGGYSNLYVNPREAFYNNTRVQRTFIEWFIAKLAPVPKDSRGPRIICKEPVTQQYYQQGIKTELYSRIERHPLTRGFVNFTDQSINQWFALVGSSIEPETVTLDMKEASDNIGDALVERTSPPEWYEIFEAVRTELVELPSGEIINLKKHAPMGSALCFPIESLVHWALCCAVYMLAGWSSETVLQSVYVYGDDIILRSLPPGLVFKVFPMLGLHFNEDKSCCTGKFRESCGVDAYDGQDVSTVKFKKSIPISFSNPESIVAWVEYSNDLHLKGYFYTSRAIQKYIDGIVKLPYVRPSADVLGYTSKRPVRFSSFLGLSQGLHPPIASAIDDRGSVHRGLTTKPDRPKESQVNDRSRYLETHLELARRQRSGHPPHWGEENTPISYAKRFSIRFHRTLTKDIISHR